MLNWEELVREKKRIRDVLAVIIVSLVISLIGVFYVIAGSQRNSDPQSVEELQEKVDTLDMPELLPLVPPGNMKFIPPPLEKEAD